MYREHVLLGSRLNCADGELAIDELRKTKTFQEMGDNVDEEEHSLEMHLPYIRHIFAGYVVRTSNHYTS